MKENEQINSQLVVDYTHEGLGVIKYGNFPIFVKYATKDQVIDLKITNLKKNYGFGEIVNVHTESPSSVKAECQFYERCGGCDIMHINYDSQLDLKQSILKNTLNKQGIEFSHIEIEKSDNPFKYRNNVIYSFLFDDKLKQVQKGYYKKSTHQVQEIETCMLQSDVANNVANKVVELLNMMESYEAYRKNLKRLQIKYSFKRNEIMIVFITKNTKIMSSPYLVEKLVEAFPEIKSINTVSDTAQKNIYKQDFIIEEILDIEYQIPVQSFFQVNTLEVEKQFSYVLENLNINNKKILDLYCGSAMISLLVAKKAKHVVGVEKDIRAIKLAKKNLVANKIENIELINSDVKDYYFKKSDFDLMIVDPPRKGLSANIIEQISAYKIPEIIYISCNPASLARDLKAIEGQYKIEQMKIFDLFSQTHHMEVVCKLKLR